MAIQRYWFISLVERSKLRLPFLFASLFTLCIATLLPSLTHIDSMPTDITHEAVRGFWATQVGNALFFSLLTSWILVCVVMICAQADQVLTELAPVLNCTPEVVKNLREEIAGASSGNQLFMLGIGLAAGLFHTLVVIDVGSSGGINPGISALIGTVTGTLLAWIMMFQVVNASMRCAFIFRAIGRDYALINLTRLEEFRSFGTIALMPCLAIVSTQALYPLLSLGGQFSWATVLPGFIGTLLAAGVLFVIPVRQLSLRIRAEKKAEIGAIDAEIDRIYRRTRQFDDVLSSGHALSKSGELTRLNDLLGWRAHVSGLPVWPMNLTSVVRWCVYLTIPPLTWVLASLTERIVDSAI